MGQIVNKQQQQKQTSIRSLSFRRKFVFLDSPNTAKLTTGGAGLGVRYGMAAMQGWRSSMEDTHCIRVGLPEPFTDWCLFAVFDGHAGGMVAEQASMALGQQLVESNGFRALRREGVAPLADEERLLVEAGVKEGFLSLDRKMRKLPRVRSGEDTSGSTVVAVIVSPRHVHLVNCGDTKAVLSRSNSPPLSTPIHKPCDAEERRRIEKAGGRVIEGRVNGYIAVSRALGDFHYKNRPNLDTTEQLITPVPDVISIDRDPSADEFVLLACDGVWDTVETEELCSTVRERLRRGDDPQELCRQIVDFSLERGSRDNLSAILVAFDDGPLQPAWSLDALIRSKVLEMIESGPIDLPTLMERMAQSSSEWSASLPPGVTIDQKSELIKAVYNERLPSTSKTQQERAVLC